MPSRISRINSDEIRQLSPLTNNSSSSRSRTINSQSAQNTMTERRRNLIKNRFLLEQPRNSIFQIDDDISSLLIQTDLDYITDNKIDEIKIDYHYRRRELAYNECITKFEQIKEAVSYLMVDENDKLLLDSETADFYLFQNILNINKFIKEEIKIMTESDGVFVKKEIFDTIKNTIEHEIIVLQRIKLVVELRISRRSHLEDEVKSKIQKFLNSINERIANLKKIELDKIKDFISTLDKERKKLIYFNLRSINLLQETIIIAFAGIIVITKTEVLNIITKAIELSKIVVYQNNISGIKEQKKLLELLKKGFLYYSNNIIKEYYKRFILLILKIKKEEKLLTVNSLKLSSSIKTQCLSTFGHFKAKEVLIEKCKKYNAKLAKKEEIDKNFDLLKKEFEYEFDDMTLIHSEIVIPAVVNYVGNSIASLFGRYLLFGENMRFNDLDNYFIINFILSEKTDSSLEKIQQSGIDEGGLRRDFITALTTELFEKKIFITREGTKKYFLNPEFEPDSIFIYIVKEISTDSDFDFDDEINYFNKFYNFIGLLLSFILVNECGIEHTLSLGIMAHFIHTTPLEPLDYIYCLLDDFPEFSTFLFKLLENRSTIIDYSKSYNDTFDLYTPKIGEEPDKDVDGDNIDDYIERFATYMMSKTILRKDIEIIKEKGETDEQLNRRYKGIVYKGQNAYSAMIEGMSMNVKTKLATSEMPIHTITSYMTAGNMSNEIIAELKANFIQSMETSINTHSSTSDHYLHLKTMRDLFISHVLTKPTDMSEINYFNFMTKLFRFWSGSTFFKKNEKYKIEVNSGLSLEHLPQSHTCFFIIDLPLYTSGTVLFEKLEKAVNYIEEGIGLQGGGRKRKILKKFKKVN